MGIKRDDNEQQTVEALSAALEGRTAKAPFPKAFVAHGGKAPAPPRR